MIASQSLGHASVASDYSRGRTISLSGALVQVQGAAPVFDAGIYDGRSPRRRATLVPQNNNTQAMANNNRWAIVADVTMVKA